MHRYREFGIVSEQDELFRRAFRDGFKRAGLSHAQFLDALAWRRDHEPPGADEAQLTEAFSEFAAARGWPAGQRDSVVDLYRAVRDQGPAAVVTAPRPEEDRATLAHADELMRRDPARYWGDGELQDAAFEARERLGDAGGLAGDGAGRGGDRAGERGGGTGEVAPAQGAARPREAGRDRQRIAEVEALLRDPSGDGQRRYWNDTGLRTDYAAALARLHGGGARQDSRAAAPAMSEVVGDSGMPPAAV